MAHKPGAKLRKADFEIPFPWSESVKYSRRYRDGWFDAYEGGNHTDKIGTYNSRGRDAYLAGFAAGHRMRPFPPPSAVSVSTDNGQPVRVTEFPEGTVTETWTPTPEGSWHRRVADGRLQPPLPSDPRVERP